MRATTSMIVLLAFGAGVAACGDPERRAISNQLPASAFTRDLGPGATGADVRALQDYLTDFGYFPNDDLARRFPRWRPLVTDRPAAGHYDAPTEDAVRAWQRNLGLEVTGLVDAVAREHLAHYRCGIPDGLEAPDRRNKFLIDDSAWDFTNIKWKFGSLAGCNLTESQMRPAMNAIANKWNSVTNLAISELIGPGTPTIWIECANLGGNRYADAFFPDWGAGNSIQINTNVTFSVAATTPSNQADFESAMLHEIGHTLGLHHSNVGSSTKTAMFHDLPLGSQKRLLSTDDTVAIGILYNPFVTVSAPCARDIAVGGTTTALSDIAWMIGCDNRVKKLEGSSWVLDTTAPGNVLAIAVQPNGRPWIVLGGTGNVLRKDSSSATSGGWTNLGSCMQDIGVGATTSDLTGGNGNGAVWALACNGAANGQARKFNGSAFVADTKANGSGKKIAVDTDGLPWLVNSAGKVYRRSSADPASGSWAVRPGDNDGTFTSATDIGVFRAGARSSWAWIIGAGATWVWNEQPGAGESGAVGATDCDNGACRAAWWQWDDGFGTDISVGPCGAWVVNDVTGTVSKRQKCQAAGAP